MRGVASSRRDAPYAGHGASSRFRQRLPRIRQLPVRLRSAVLKTLSSWLRWPPMVRTSHHGSILWWMHDYALGYRHEVAESAAVMPPGLRRQAQLVAQTNVPRLQQSLEPPFQG